MATEEQQRTTRGEATSPASTDREWSAEQKNLLEERRKLAWAAQHAYFERASILNALNYLIGVPVVLITALAASEIVLSRAEGEPVPLYVGLITVSATVLASLQTFFRFGEKSAFSATAGNRYAVLRRRIEDALATPPENPGQELEEIRIQAERAGAQSPPIGERRWLTWEDYARKGQVPSRRRGWRAMLGVPESKRSRRSQAKKRQTGEPSEAPPG